MGIGSFIGTLIAAEIVARLLLPALPVDTHTWPRAEIGQKLEQIEAIEQRGQGTDVLFAGSSLTAAGVNPQAFTRATGLSSYNAAFAGPSMRTVARWVLDIVEPKLSPDVVVVGVASRDVNDNAAKNLGMFENFIRSPGYKQETASFASRVEGWLEDASTFMRYRRLFREPATLLDQSSEKLKQQRIRKEIGARGLRLDDPRNYFFSAKMASRLHDNVLAEFSVGGGEARALQEMSRELQARGVEMILLNMPVTSDYVASHVDPEADVAQFHALLTEFARKSEVILVNAEDAFADSTPFRDLMHLDVEGRDALTDALASGWSRLDDGTQLEVSCSSEEVPECSMEPLDHLGLTR